MSVPFVLSPPANIRLTRQLFRKPDTKVLGPRSIEFWGARGGFWCVQSMKEEHQEYISPRCRSRGRLAFEDLVVEGEVIVVRNKKTRLEATWCIATKLRNLPLFSLQFTKYLIEGLVFCTIWHKEVDGWLEELQQ